MAKPFNRELERIETELKVMMATRTFPFIVAEYNRLLGILGNVGGDEIIALVLLATYKVEA